jgi:hypothetical protein
MRGLVALLLCTAGCTSVGLCRAQTIHVAVTLAGATAQADQLAIVVAVAGGGKKMSQVVHATDVASGGLEIYFPSGYPLGKTIVITVTALERNVALGSGNASVTATSSCAATMLIVSAGTPPGDLGGRISDSFSDGPGSISDGGASDLASSDGGTPCIPAPESCFNGIDDDCNGLIDCADPACNPTATCVPAVSGASYGTLLPSGSCPQANATAMPLYNNFSNAPASCTGCGFDANISNIQMDVYSDNDGASCVSQAQSTLQGTLSTTTACTTLTLYGQFQFNNMRGGSCTYFSGSPSLPSPQLTKNEFCASATTGGGCGAGSVCAPRVANDSVCILTSDATCPASYPNATSWYGAIHDGRSCSSCMNPVGQPYGTLRLFTTTNCTGAYTSVNFSETSSNSTTSVTCTPASASGHSMTFDYFNCSSASVPVMGTVTGMGPVATVCCK